MPEQALSLSKVLRHLRHGESQSKEAGMYTKPQRPQCDVLLSLSAKIKNMDITAVSTERIGTTHHDPWLLCTRINRSLHHGAVLQDKTYRYICIPLVSRLNIRNISTKSERTRAMSLAPTLSLSYIFEMSMRDFLTACLSLQSSQSLGSRHDVSLCGLHTFHVPHRVERL
jgi:hypothetical protein